GVIERIGSSEAVVTYEQAGASKVRETKPVLKHKQAIQAAFDAMTAENGVVKHLEEIEAVGHRIVHGGENFSESVIIDHEVLKHIEAAAELAPLHVPNNLKGYHAAVALIPHAQNVAVFDTAFHHTMPARAFMYGVPYLYYKRDKLRRYGFHGTSHRYVSSRFAKLQGKTREDFKLITCHLGNGCSVCAIEHGRSIDTSMGFTPIEGLLMGTRPGDVDAGAVMYLVEHAEMGVHEIDVLLNKHSGIYGISGVSNDMRDVLDAESKGNERAKLAVDVFCYRVRKYLGAYLAAMNGADAILFAAGIGENSPAIRERICAGMDSLGVALDPEKNTAARGKDADISANDARVKTWVIPTNEELLIARDTVRAILHLPQA
ncbi:MAG: acetate kinase, partial [Acidobacteriaceae bacterium]|nr:acetate kinase [Acidobacteriaceae bacterium]